MIRLGDVQIGCLEALVDHQGWIEKYAHPWVWDTPSRTKRVLGSLRKHGLVSRDREGIWRITGSGRRTLKQVHDETRKKQGTESD